MEQEIKKSYSTLIKYAQYDEDELTLREVLHSVAKHNLSDDDYEEFCELLEAKSLSEADNAEYIALETKAKEPILNALDSFNFTDCFVAIMGEKLNRVEMDNIRCFETDNENLSIWLIFVALAFDDTILNSLLHDELIGDKMSIVDKWDNFISDFDMDSFNDYDEGEDEHHRIYKIINDDEIDNDKKLQKILRRFDDSDRKTITDFESISGEVVKVVKDFLNQPLIELYRDSD